MYYHMVQGDTCIWAPCAAVIRHTFQHSGVYNNMALEP